MGRAVDAQGQPGHHGDARRRPGRARGGGRRRSRSGCSRGCRRPRPGAGQRVEVARGEQDRRRLGVVGRAPRVARRRPDGRPRCRRRRWRRPARPPTSTVGRLPAPPLDGDGGPRRPSARPTTPAAAGATRPSATRCHASAGGHAAEQGPQAGRPHRRRATTSAVTQASSGRSGAMPGLGRAGAGSAFGGGHQPASRRSRNGGSTRRCRARLTDARSSGGSGAAGPAG